MPKYKTEFTGSTSTALCALGLDLNVYSTKTNNTMKAQYGLTNAKNN